MLDDSRELLGEQDALPVGEQTAKHRVLQALAMPAHHLEHLAPAPVIADVIGHDICSAGGERRVVGQLAIQHAAQQAQLHLQHAPVADAIAKDRMGDQVGDAMLEDRDELLAAGRREPD